MQVEHDIRIIPLDDNFDKELQTMQADGWKPAPGFPPFAVYPIVRDQTVMEHRHDNKTAGFGGVLGGHIDDSKIHIIRAGDKK